MAIGMRADVMASFDRALDQRNVLRLAEEIAGDEEARLDLLIAQDIEDVLGAFAEITAGEDQGDLLLRSVAAYHAAVIEGPRSILKIIRQGRGSGGHGASEKDRHEQMQ